MFFWFLMLFFDLMIPFTMIGFSKSFLYNVPDEINGVFGYRTTRSMKNKATWAFAHHYCGKLWFISGKIMLITTMIAMLFVLGKNTYTVGYFGGILCVIQTIYLMGTILPTEVALKNNFDKFGNLR